VRTGNWVTFAENVAPLLVIAGMYVAFTWRSKIGRRRTRVAGSQGFENIVAREVYDAETKYWWRLGVISGIFFGAGMALMTLPTLYSNPNLLWHQHPLTGSMLGGLDGGLLLGVLFPALWKRRTKTFIDGLYNGEEWITELPPPGFHIYYKLPCTWNDDQAAVGGILYLGRQGLIYVPHKRNGRAYPPFTMSPIETVKTALVQPPFTNAIRKLLGPKPQPQLEITSQKSCMRFIVPQPPTTITALNRLLDSIRNIPK
jgi:hypothetical protein